jgi:plastocyanin
MPRRLIAIAALGAAAAATAAPALAGSTPPSRSIEVGDNYFAPTRLTVNKGTRLVFRWPASNDNRHDVALDSGPSGVSKFNSPVRTSSYTYRRTLRTAGTYRIICTLHATQMRLTVRVRRGG